MDPLSDILKKVSLSSAVYFSADFSAPWGMDIPKGPFAQFHIVTKGQCLLKTKVKEVQLNAGDIIIFPKGASHWLADSDSSHRKEGSSVVKAIMDGESMFVGDSISTNLVCGHFEFNKNIEHPFINDLPEVIYIPNSDMTELSWLRSISNLVIQEMNDQESGNDIIVNKLGEVLFIHAIRAFIKREAPDKGFLAALRDTKMSKVLSAIHNAPEKDWQLSSMAQEGGMSRTSFSNKFKNVIGETPMAYLTNWRILLAREQLSETSRTVGEIAENVGYQSEAAFIRVFKKQVALTPLKFRHSLFKSKKLLSSTN